MWPSSRQFGSLMFACLPAKMRGLTMGIPKEPFFQSLAHPARESDTRLEIEKILAGWDMRQDFESVSRLENGLDLFEEIDELQVLIYPLSSVSIKFRKISKISGSKCLPRCSRR
jgi:hypothetical protein